MKYNANTYVPYPILRPEAYDYPEGEFTTELSKERLGDNLHLECNFNIKEPTVLNQVKDGKADYCILVYCGAACYTEVFRASEGSTVVSAVISCNNLKGNVEVHPFVISVEDIPLSTSTAHSEYGGAPIVVEKGKQLASSLPWSFTVKQTGTIESVFRLERESAKVPKLRDGEFDFEAEPAERHIVISANQKTYDEFNDIRSESKLTRATVYTNALIVALCELPEEPDENEPPDGWAVTLRERLRTEDTDSKPVAAQRMLGNPLAYLSEFTI